MRCHTMDTRTSTPVGLITSSETMFESNTEYCDLCTHNTPYVQFSLITQGELSTPVTSCCNNLIFVTTSSILHHTPPADYTHYSCMYSQLQDEHPFVISDDINIPPQSSWTSCKSFFYWVSGHLNLVPSNPGRQPPYPDYYVRVDASYFWPSLGW
jgi:hypothetical protein